MGLIFQKAQAPGPLESWRAVDAFHSFAIIKYPDGRYGASAKPFGGAMLDGTTHWLGGPTADREPIFTNFDDAKAACERFHSTGK